MVQGGAKWELGAEVLKDRESLGDGHAVLLRHVESGKEVHQDAVNRTQDSKPEGILAPASIAA